MTNTEPEPPEDAPEDAVLPSMPSSVRYTPDRKRLSLNIRASEYLELEELARLTHSPTQVAAIVKSVAMARKIFYAEHPEVRYAHRPREEWPLPSYWAVHTPKPDGTEDVHRLVIW